MNTNHKQLNYSVEEINGLLNKVENQTNYHINIKDYGAVGDGIVDDTCAIQTAINIAMDSIYKNETRYENGYKTTIVFPAGRYKITSTITSYPQLVLVSEGFVQLQSYVANGSCLHIKYPVNYIDNLIYVGDIINGSHGGFYINNMLIDHNPMKTEDWMKTDWGGNNIGLELGNRMEEINYHSDTRFLARYGICDVYINNFRTGIRFNQINQWMCHGRQVRVALSDVCIQVGETEGFKSDVSIENYTWTSCMFERSNTLLKVIRNGVGQVFDKCSIDFIRKDCIINTVSGIPRLYFNGCWLEKLRGLFFVHTQENAYDAIGNNIYLKGCHMLLPFRKLFSTINNNTSVTIEDCAWLRDSYYEQIDNENAGVTTNLFSGHGKYMCDENTHVNNISITPYASKGLPLISENYNSISDGGFKKILETRNLKDENVVLPKWWESISFEGVNTGVLEISNITDMMDNCTYHKSLKFQPSSTSNYANLTINTKKININKNKKLNLGLFLKATSYSNISFATTITYYDINDNKLTSEEFTKDSNSTSLKNFVVNDWNVLNLISDSTGNYVIPPRGTAYIKINYKFDSSNVDAHEEITGFFVEEL